MTNRELHRRRDGNFMTGWSRSKQTAFTESGMGVNSPQDIRWTDNGDAKWRHNKGYFFYSGICRGG